MLVICKTRNGNDCLYFFERMAVLFDSIRSQSVRVQMSNMEDECKEKR